MAWKPDYITSAELKAWLRIADSIDDTEVAVAITTASRDVDQFTNRQFGLEASAVARRYTYACGDRIEGRPALAIDDLQTTTGLAVAVDDDDDGTFETTLTLDTDFALWPYNAPRDGMPWTHLVLTSYNTVGFTQGTGRVQVTGRFGWTDVPVAVKFSTRLQASRFLGDRSAWFGIAGSPEAGNEVRLLDRVHPDVEVALRPYRRVWAAA